MKHIDLRLPITESYEVKPLSFLDIQSHSGKMGTMSERARNYRENSATILRETGKLANMASTSIAGSLTVLNAVEGQTTPAIIYGGLTAASIGKDVWVARRGRQ